MVSKRCRRSLAEAFVDKAELGRLLRESAEEAICALDMMGNCTFCNSAFLRLLRTSPQSSSLVCHQVGGELEQIQFLLGHISIQTTE